MKKNKMIVITIVWVVLVAIWAGHFVTHVYPKLKAEIKDIIHNPK